MSNYPNPSEGKFGPPTPPPAPDRPRPRRSRLLFLLLILSGYPSIHWLLSRRGSGWLAAVGPLAAFALAILHYLLQRQRAEESSDKNPYSSPTSLTR